MDYKKITHLPYYLYLQIFDRKRIKSGLVRKEVEDTRDYKTSVLGWSLFGYTPKNQKLFIPPLMFFNQGDLNCCVFCGTLSHKMDDEKVELLASDAISYAVRKGWVSGNGFANVDTCFKVLKEYGCREGKNPEVLSNWAVISTLPLNTVEAGKHKIQSYWNVNSRADRLKLLDEGHTLNTGIDWYTIFNQGGGFTSPWLITKKGGYRIGGHDIKICGYDLNYYGHKVYIFVNSYGKNWANKGVFYIDMDYFDANNYGVQTSLDVQADTASFLNKYDGKNVKGSSSTIYFIQNGKKKAYPNWATYLAYKVATGNGFIFLTKDEENTLNQIPAGDNMDITKSTYWGYMNDIVNADDDDNTLLNALLITFNKLGISI